MRSLPKGIGWLLAAVLLLPAGGALAAPSAPVVDGLALSHVWGSVYRLSARVRSERGNVTGAEFRVGAQTGTLFASDGLLDSPEEQVETFVDLSQGPPAAGVRAKAGGAWSEWVRIDELGLDEPGAACALSMEKPGDGTWSRGEVQVDCTAWMGAEGASGVEYSVGFGDWAPSQGMFVIADEGVHWLQVRTVSDDGAYGLPETFPVAVDRTPPSVYMGAQVPPALTHADVLVPDFGAEDALSGVALVAGDLDGEQELYPGVPVELWELAPGMHTLTVYARDHAGNTAELPEAAYFEVTVDLTSLARLVQLFGARGRMEQGLSAKLTGHLAAAAEMLALGDEMGAGAELESFAGLVQEAMADRSLPAAEGEVLLSDVAWVAGQLGLW